MRGSNAIGADSLGTFSVSSSTKANQMKIILNLPPIINQYHSKRVVKVADQEIVLTDDQLHQLVTPPIEVSRGETYEGTIEEFFDEAPNDLTEQQRVRQNVLKDEHGNNVLDESGNPIPGTWVTSFVLSHVDGALGKPNTNDTLLSYTVVER